MFKKDIPDLLVFEPKSGYVPIPHLPLPMSNPRQFQLTQPPQPVPQPHPLSPLPPPQQVKSIQQPDLLISNLQDDS